MLALEKKKKKKVFKKVNFMEKKKIKQLNFYISF